MRWPFGPPHLILKPSKKTQKTKKTEKNKKTRKKKPPPKKQQKYQKIAFQLSVNYFFFWVAFQIFPFLTPWPKKRSPPKHYKIGVSGPFFGKADVCVTKRPFLDKKPKFINFSYHFFLHIFFSFNNKNPKFAETPSFYSVLANLKKENFQKK